jgi:hypothetical protein
MRVAVLHDAHQARESAPTAAFVIRLIQHAKYLLPVDVRASFRLVRALP